MKLTNSNVVDEEILFAGGGVIETRPLTEKNESSLFHYILEVLCK